MVDNRPHEALPGIYSLEELGKKLILSRTDTTKTRVISKGGLKEIPQYNIEIEKDILERLSGW